MKLLIRRSVRHAVFQSGLMIGVLASIAQGLASNRPGPNAFRNAVLSPCIMSGRQLLSEKALTERPSLDYGDECL